VGPRIGLDAVGKIKMSCPCQKTNPDSLVVQPVAVPTELSQLKLSFKATRNISLTFKDAYKSLNTLSTTRSSLYIALSLTDRTTNVSPVIAFSLVARDTTCLQSCSLATAVVLSHVSTAVTWQWVYHATFFKLILAG
jgi:hypothetical protein